MQRYPLKFRLSTYNECDFYQLCPIGRRAVAPGERVSRIMVDTRFTSAVYDKAILTPVLAQSWAFYVPNRLVWDQWIDFIAMDETITSPPMTSTAAPKYLEGVAGSRPALFRRGYKLIYNQYFGDESEVANGGWFANVNDDTDINLGRLLVWDQFRSHSRRASYTQSSFSAAVSGATASIPLDDFARAVRGNNSRRRQKMTGDKYVDTMRLMGVELDWRVQMAPEFLGASQQVLYGTIQQSAAATDLTTKVTQYEGRQQLMVKRPLAFAEHGMIHVLTGFRPLVANPGAQVYDAFMSNLDMFFRPDTAQGPLNSGAQQLERNTVYLKGRNVVGNFENGNAFTEAGSVSALYPDPAAWTPHAGSGPRALGMMTDLSISGLTPVPANRV